MPSLFMRAASSIAIAGVATPIAIALLASCAKETPFACDLNSDCDVGFYCADDGTCKTECVDATRDCPMGYVCSDNGRCEFHGDTGGAGPTGSSVTGSTTTSSSPTTGVTTSNATTGATTTTSVTTGSSMTGKGQLDPCFSESECDSGLHCRAMFKGGSSRCTTTCSSDAQCPAGFRCDDPGDGISVCLMSDVGKACANGNGALCNFACIPGPNVCTTRCTSGSDCPNGWGCEMVGGQSVCVRAEAYCSSSDTSACVVPAACDQTSTQLLVSGCTLACNTAADCPRRAAGLAQWTCNGLCQRPPDVYGPLEVGYAPAQYACNAMGQVVNLCNDGQHIDFNQFTIPNPPAVNCSSPTTTDGVPGDVCVDSCRYQGGCPFDYACSAVAQIGTDRAGLCLPTGFGEVGAACTKDGDCAFGLCSAGHCSRDCTHDGVCPTGSTCVAPGGPGVEGQPFKRCQ